MCIFVRMVYQTYVKENLKQDGKTKSLIYFFLSNLLINKGVFVLLDALRILKEKGYLFNCQYVGGETAEINAVQFSEEVDKRDLNDRVAYVGRKVGEEKNAFFQQADVFVFPTYYYNECFPLVILEAMEYKLPAISTNEGGIPDMVKDGENGLICEKQNPYSLADCIAKLLDDEELRVKMGNAGYDKFCREFTLQQFEHRMLDILSQNLPQKEKRKLIFKGRITISMLLKLKNLPLLESHRGLTTLPSGKLLINTINAHSYNTAQKDKLFAEALQQGDVLIPDGASIVKACRWLNARSKPTERIAGWNLFEFEMNKLNTIGGKCFFMGSSEKVLALIKQRVKVDYPNIEVETYSPPYKPEFSEEDNRAIVEAINKANPDLLWIGMTAPKQEKWAYTHWHELKIHCHCGTIGAVFDFYAGTVKRAPAWWQRHSLEWCYRLLKEPRRMWKRYIIGNLLFMWNICKE